MRPLHIDRDEGCVCAHGYYNHADGASLIGRLAGNLRSNCIRCDCQEFRHVPARALPGEET